jgi:GAF domain/Pyridoxamine 5'-phosphate oxidase
MSTPPVALSTLTRCFQGIIPCIVATCDAGGVPNVTYVSQVHWLDDRHVALSRQFFNKTTRNLQVNPRACVEVYDPVTFEAWRLRVRFVREETSGPLFETMALRIEAIASHTGMSGVFRLLAAEVFEVEHVARVEGFLGEVPEAAEDVLSMEGHRTELRGLQGISERINRATSLEELFDAVLEAIETFFGFRYTMILLHEETCRRLQTIASHGYGPAGIGAEVELGDGILGTVGRERRVLRISGLDHDLSYGRAVRRETESSGSTVAPEIPLPGLTDARSALALPLLFQDRLVGVLSAESRDPLQFDEWDEGYLQVVANHIALGIERMREPGEREERETATASEGEPDRAGEERSNELAGRKHSFTYYRNDDCVFVDGEYLIRNVPGRILWKVLRTWSHEGRTAFTNRELRLDPSLGLPPIKDNLESRLILLRRRLEQKCTEVQLVPTGRGRFSLVIGGPVELVEKESGSVTP